jgi:hypothetical protein
MHHRKRVRSYIGFAAVGTVCMIIGIALGLTLDAHASLFWFWFTLIFGLGMGGMAVFAVTYYITGYFTMAWLKDQGCTPEQAAALADHIIEDW